MFPILETEHLAPEITRFVIEAPRVARRRKPGQFVIVRLHDRGERIPLTIADADPDRGTVTLIVQGVGKTTRLMNLLGPGDAVLDLVGPLGTPSDVRLYGTVVVIGGGVGTAIAWPTARALKEAGNRVLAIIGARTKDLVILEDEMRAIADELVVVTDDGSLGRKGVVVDPLCEWILRRRRIDLVLAIGPVRMMQAVAELTRPAGIRTIVSLNSLMVDGTGMCGGCRVATSEGTRFACVDGPEFDAHTIDFNTLARRNCTYASSEAAALGAFLADPAEALDRVRKSCRMEHAPPPEEVPAP